MTRVGISVYLLLFILFSGLSILAAGVGTPALLWLEGGVDVVFVAGVALYLRGVRWRPWRFFLVPALAGEVGILMGIGEATPEDYIVTALILAPAFYLNARVCRDSSGGRSGSGS